MPDPNKITTLVEQITVDQDGHDQIITLVVRYTGSVNVMNKIQEGEELSIEIPSTSPPG